MVVLEVAIVSNYEWSEKQIEAAIKKGRKRSQEDWLGVAVFKVGDTRDVNKKKAKAPDYRQLMKILVVEGYAVGNGKSSENPHFKIRFDSSKQKSGKESYSWLLMEAHNFPPLEVLPPSKFSRYLQRELTFEDLYSYLELRQRWLFIVLSLMMYRDTGRLEVTPVAEQIFNKHEEESFLALVREIDCMCKAVKIGWEYIKAKNRDADYERLIVYLLKIMSSADFVTLSYPPEERVKTRMDLERLQDIAKFNKQKEALPIEHDKAEKFIAPLVNRFLLRRICFEHTDSLKSILCESHDPEVLDALSAWDDATQKSIEIIRKNLRRLVGQKTKASKSNEAG
jgi:hypothetical protein